MKTGAESRLINQIVVSRLEDEKSGFRFMNFESEM